MEVHIKKLQDFILVLLNYVKVSCIHTLLFQNDSTLSLFIIVHGEPDMGEKKAGATTLNDRLIHLTFSLRPSMDDVSPVQNKSQLQAAKKSIEKRVLGTMKIRNLRQVIQKLLRVPATHQHLYLIQNGAQDNEMLVTELGDDLRDLHFYSAAAGDDITVVHE